MDNEHREFLEEVLRLAKKKGAEYADCRLYPNTESEQIKLENGQITTLNSSQSAGFGVRVLAQGSWGFYATPILDRQKIEEVVKRAVHSASINATIPKNKEKLRLTLKIFRIKLKKMFADMQMMMVFL